MKNWEPLLENVLVIGIREKREWDCLRVLSGIGHGEQIWLVVLELEVLILKLLTVDGLATGTLIGPVSTNPLCVCLLERFLHLRV